MVEYKVGDKVLYYKDCYTERRLSKPKLITIVRVIDYVSPINGRLYDVNLGKPLYASELQPILLENV